MSPRKKGKISLIALCFNHESYLDQLFHSINDNLRSIGELLIIDNGSSDDSVMKIEGFVSELGLQIDTKIFRNCAGTSVPKAVNEALKEAEQEYVAVISGDDFLLPNRFEGQLTLLEKDDGVKFSYANGVECDEAGVLSKDVVHDSRMVKILKGKPTSILPSLYYPTPALFTQAALFRREALVSIGGWDESVIIDDWALNLKLFESYPANFVYHNENVFAYRRHPSNASKRRFRQYKGQLQIVDKYLPETHAKNCKFSHAQQCLLSVKN